MGSISTGDVGTILLLNLGLFVLNLALSGICFLTSCTFNLSKNVIAVGGGLVGAFQLFSLMGMFGESFHWMKNLTPVNRILHWEYSKEQKTELKNAVSAGIPKSIILEYFYPDVPVERMKAVRETKEAIH